MGYYATGSGSITVKIGKVTEAETAAQIEQDLEQWVSQKIADAGLEPVFVTLNQDEAEVELNFNGKYWEDEILSALDTLSLFISDGEIEFSGEDDSHWKFFFRNGRWNEVNGEVVYGETDKPEPPICVLKDGVLLGIFNPQTGKEIPYSLLDLWSLAQEDEGSPEQKEHLRLKKLLEGKGVQF